MEFSIRFLSNPYEWVPLSYTIINQEPGIECSRGYCVSDTISLNSISGSPTRRRNIRICDFSLNDSVQFRWLMSSYINQANRGTEDRWSLDDIEVNLIDHVNIENILLDSFDSNSFK